jgi:hypothetical protein
MPKEEPVDLKQLARLEENLKRSGHEQESDMIRRAVDELDHLRTQVEKLQSQLED